MPITHLQDAFAVKSHKKAAAAKAAGKFKDEIVPVSTKVVDPKTGQETPVVVTEDDGVRADATVESLGTLKAVFKKGGSTTAGNSSQVGLLDIPVTLYLRLYAGRTFIACELKWHKCGTARCCCHVPLAVPAGCTVRNLPMPLT